MKARPALIMLVEDDASLRTLLSEELEVDVMRYAVLQPLRKAAMGCGNGART